jgi:hypothetical protein
MREIIKFRNRYRNRSLYEPLFSILMRRPFVKCNNAKFHRNRSTIDHW